MNIKKLKELIAELPDEMKVLIPAQPSEGFTGVFFSPCEQDSGELEMGGDETMSEEDVEKAINLGSLETDKSFVLVPCGFYDEKDHAHQLN